MCTCSPYYSHVVKHIFKYLQGRVDRGLLLHSSIDSSITIAYSDADWASCKDTCCSTTGYTVYFGLNVIAWRSKKQPIISKFSTKDEYRVVGYTIAETIWLCKILFDLGITLLSLLLQCECYIYDSKSS